MKKSKKMLTLSIIQVFLLIIILVCLSFIIMWFINNKENKAILKELSTAVKQEESKDYNKYNVDFEKLKTNNKDVKAWLKVNGTNIDYPVVQAKDNEYYLKHSFNKKYNIAGWIFFDCNNRLDGTDKNIVIYGHNTKDGSMFGSLKNILTKDWCKKEENKYITYISENENCIYEVFSVYQTKKENYYITTKFNDNEFSEFITNVKNKSIYNFDTTATNDDSLLTLSTCANNNQYRVVLHAKKVKTLI